MSGKIKGVSEGPPEFFGLPGRQSKVRSGTMDFSAQEEPCVGCPGGPHKVVSPAPYWEIVGPPPLEAPMRIRARSPKRGVSRSGDFFPKVAPSRFPNGYGGVPIGKPCSEANLWPIPFGDGPVAIGNTFGKAPHITAFLNFKGIPKSSFPTGACWIE